ncbi:hypothetical protein GGI25_001658 [Coemansia spiralis]|uniref:SCP domain-containing protein n=2 Tax=Coemansia TaxID=4863 RepID=A0A9W8GA23_9FUNG|nr:hypothetical protein BX070DRAFT_237575 [Coemansia spiralis]KAJ1988112.1 hypothetical protein EDC05_005494 [Coemansia umbellata]KAJ2623910.1 hypothetical protein GGI26_001925 [Coemansia sp. RSA 1358]KAJ2679302.1 hypothetical protein GGI25_001658 [Coemansia spiralis]
MIKPIVHLLLAASLLTLGAAKSSTDSSSTGSSSTDSSLTTDSSSSLGHITATHGVPVPTLPPKKSSSSQGSFRDILCQLNRDRRTRYELPVFLHKTLTKVAQSLGEKYADGKYSSSDFNQLFESQLAPLGQSVSASFKILGKYDSDDDFVDAVENSIYHAVFSRNLEAIGLYEDEGTYTIVLATGLKDKPSPVDACPSSAHQYSPPNSDDGDSSNVNGIDLPHFLCKINRERTNAKLDPFAVHTALADEAEAQAKQMVSLGHYTVDGPRKVDDSIYGQRVMIKRLYWFAGDRYHSADALIDLLMSSYADIILDPAYSVIGVAQEKGYWSVILGEMYRSVRVNNACPTSVDDITFTS